METTQRLVFNLEEPGDDPLADKVFDILNNSLQPSGDISVENTTKEITALLPEGKVYSSEVGSFLNTCYEVVEQIPSDHPSMIKLVTIIDSCLNSSRLGKDETGDTSRTDPTLRYQKLGETLRDWWNSSTPSEDPFKFINFQTFVARIHQRGMLQGPDLAIWTIQDAEEKSKEATEDERNAYTKAASQWLLLQGDEIYEEVAKGKVKESQWRDWYDQLGTVAANKVRSKGPSYDGEVVELAGKALVAMEAFERQKAG